MPEFGSLMQNIILSKDHRIVHYSIINSLQKVSLVTIYMYLCQQYNTFVPVTVFYSLLAVAHILDLFSLNNLYTKIMTLCCLTALIGNSYIGRLPYEQEVLI